VELPHMACTTPAARRPPPRSSRRSSTFPAHEPPASSSVAGAWGRRLTKADPSTFSSIATAPPPTLPSAPPHTRVHARRRPLLRRRPLFGPNRAPPR
jgi:hypothetical protein